MKNPTLRQVPRAFGQVPARGCAVLLTLLLASANLTALPLVDTLTGGPSQFYPQTAYGYQDGDTATTAKFHTPYEIGRAHV